MESSAPLHRSAEKVAVDAFSPRSNKRSRRKKKVKAWRDTPAPGAREKANGGMHKTNRAEAGKKGKALKRFALLS